MLNHKRVLYDVCSSIRGGECDGDDETGGGEPKQSEDEKFTLPARKQILEHRDRAVAIRTLRRDTPVHRERAKQREEDQNECSDWRQCACGQESDAGLVTECRKIIHTGQAHHLPPRVLLVCGRVPVRGIASSSALIKPELKLSPCSLKQPHAL